MNFRSALAPLFNVLRFLGGAPHLYRSSTGRHAITFAIGTSHTLISAVVLQALVYYNYQSAEVRYNYIALWSGLISCALSLLLSILRGETLHRALVGMDHIDRLISAGPRELRKITVVILAHAFACIGVHGYGLISTVLQPVTTATKVVYSSFFMSDCMVVLLNAGFAGLMLVLRYFFRAVNSRLESRAQKAHGNAATLSTEVDSAMDLHAQLCRTAHVVNAAYDLHIVTWVLASFIVVTVNIYLAFVVSVRPSKGTEGMVIVWVLWAGVHAVRLCFTMHICHSTALEANRIAVITTKMLTWTDDHAFCSQLENYSLILLHRKIQFSCFGLFPLDHTLLYNVVGAITTYTVIICQFYFSSRPIQYSS